MDRRELLKHSMLAAGLASSGLIVPAALAQQQAAGKLDPAAGSEGGPLNVREAQAYSVGLQAFLYGFPLVYFATIRWIWSNDPNSVKRPINSWLLTRDFISTSNYRDGGSYNTDTVYTGAFNDLRGGPIVLTIPNPGPDRYFSVQLSDLYTNNFAYISKRAGGPRWGNFLLVPPGYKGDIPKDRFDRVLNCEQNWIFTLVRLRIDQDSAEDIAYGKATFAKTRITPMSDFLAGREFVASDLNVLNVTQFANNPLRPFEIINRMLVENPPPESDRIILDGFRTVGIGAGMDLSKIDADTRRGLARAARDGMPVLRSFVERPWARSVNGWYYFPTNIGQAHTTDYVMRSAWQSLWGIVAHPRLLCGWHTHCGSDRLV